LDAKSRFQDNARKSLTSLTRAARSQAGLDGQVQTQQEEERQTLSRHWGTADRTENKADPQTQDITQNWHYRGTIDAQTETKNN